MANSWLYLGLGAIIVFFLGACLGSFLNVVLYRKARGEDWVKGRSKCENCAHQIAWYDNIPLFSWLMLGGRCRHCKGSISFIHPVMEMLMGLLFLWWFAVGSWFFQLAVAPLTMIQPAFWLVVGILMVILVIIDYQDKIIPDWLNLCLVVWTLLYRLLLCGMGAMQWSDFGVAVVTGLVAGAVFWLFHYVVEWLYGRDGFGLGDVKFIAVMGLLLGWPKIMVALMAAFGLGAIVGVVLVLLGKKARQTEFAFGPFLVIGTLVALIWGAVIWEGLMGWLF